MWGGVVFFIITEKICFFNSAQKKSIPTGDAVLLSVSLVSAGRAEVFVAAEGSAALGAELIRNARGCCGGRRSRLGSLCGCCGGNVVNNGRSNIHHLGFLRSVDGIIFIMTEGCIAGGAVNKAIGIPGSESQFVVHIGYLCIAVFAGLLIGQSAVPCRSLIAHFIVSFL